MNPQNQQNSNAYDHNQIKYLEPREHVRLRPGMYIGGTDKKALHQMLWEVLDDAISEFENTAYNEITISLLPNRTISVADDGNGLPLELHISGKPLAEVHMTQVAGRYSPRGSEFLISGGLHGVGVSTVNALSSLCQLEIKRDGYLWLQTYVEGLPSFPLERILPLGQNDCTGTAITFRPDFSIMEEDDFDFYLIADHCQKRAYTLPQLNFTIQDWRGTLQQISYHYPNGLSDWLNVRTIGENSVIGEQNIQKHSRAIGNQGSCYPITVQIAFKWIESPKHLLCGFVNTLEIPEGGTHIDGFIVALENQIGLNWDKLQQGFIGIIHILHPDPQFESQTRIRLLNKDVATAVDEAVEALFAAHPEAKEAIRAHFKQA
jgi:DNA gyrase subunit B